MSSYFIVNNNSKEGPYSIDELKNKNIDQNTLVWHKGLTEWVTASEVEKIKELLNEEPPPIPGQNKFVSKEEIIQKVQSSSKNTNKIDWNKVDNYVKSDDFKNFESKKEKIKQFKVENKNDNKEKYFNSFHHKETMKSVRWILFVCGAIHLFLLAKLNTSSEYLSISTGQIGFRVFINFTVAYAVINDRIGKEKVKNIFLSPFLIYLLIFIIRLILGEIIFTIFPSLM